jgi:drug/metabolite transporter (DMT)-like permease
MTWSRMRSPSSGVLAALGAAVLFGTGTPIAKLLLEHVSPWLLAGLLYLGSGLGLAVYRVLTRAPSVKLLRREIPWFAGAVVSGGMVAPFLLMLGLNRMPASGASLLLNAEGVFTALLAWFAFKENFDRRIALGMLAILFGASLLSWSGEARFSGLWPTLAILGACLAWGIDNNLTRKVSLVDATWIASVKGIVAGTVNLVLAFVFGASWPPALPALGAIVVGFFACGVSLTLFIVGLRHLGTARTSAYFSIAPFLGAMLAVAMGERITLSLLVAGSLMALGVWLHLTETHDHEHFHESLEHEHEHVHDPHHRHAHAEPIDGGEPHRHRHRHIELTHSHPHFPDSHHQHDHR